MKKTKDKKLSYVIAVAALIAITASFVLVAISYVKKFDQTLLEENRSHLAEISAHIKAYTYSVVRDTQDSLELAAEAVFIMKEEQRLPYLKEMAERQEFAFVGYAWKDGWLHATEQTQNADIKKETYYQNAMKGEQTVTGLERRIFTDRAASGILMAVPIGGQAGAPAGVLVAMLDISRLRDALGVESFKGEGYSYIIDRNGNLILHNKSMDYHNFYKVLDNVALEGKVSSEEIQKEIRAGKEEMISYELLGIRQYAYFCPLGLNSWTVVNIVARDAVTKNTGILTKELVSFIVITCIVFLSLLVLAGASWAITQNHRHAAATQTLFLANISHEIRTPMIAIVGISEILLRSELQQKQEECIRSIWNSGKLLLSIVNDILDLSRIDAGSIVLLKESYDVRELLYDIATTAALRIGNKPVKFLVKIDEPLPEKLVGDEARIKQILVHLIRNSEKYTEEGCICLSIWAEKKDEKVELRMQLSDTGRGLEKQDVHKLFDSFSKIDLRHGYHVEETGLGLAISRSLSRMMGGNIEARSEAEKGTVYTVYLFQELLGDNSICSAEKVRDKNLLILEEDETVGKYFASRLDRLPINYLICKEEMEFEAEVQGGNYEYALAGREEVRRITEEDGEGGARNVRLGILLPQEEYLFMSANQKTPTVYVPLFDLHLRDFLAVPAGQQVKGVRNRLNICPLRHVRILIVDDNQLNLEIEESLMEPYHMMIDCVLSGKEALAAVKNKNYDLIFMDHMMPEMDGVETFRMLRSIEGGFYRHIPIVALTANATSEAQAMFFREGFDGFLAKPVDIYKMNEILEKFLRQINLKREEAIHDEPEGSL